MRKLTTMLAALAAAALTLPGAANAQQKITIGIPTSPPNIVHMPVIVAKELGLYKKAGLDVDIVSLGDGVKVFRALLAGNIDLGPDARRADHHRHFERRRREGAVGQPAEVRSLDDRARRHQDDGGPQGQAHRHPGARRLCRPPQPQRAARGQDRSQGRQLRQHRERRRSRAGRQPGRYRDPARRTGNVREVESARPARRSPACGSCSPRRSTPTCRRPRRRSRTSRMSCRPSSPPISRRRASCTPTTPRSCRSWSSRPAIREDDPGGELRLPGAAVHLGRQQRPQPGADQLHRRADDQGRQHQRGQDAEIR